MFRFERGLRPRNRFSGEASEGAAEAPSDRTKQMGPFQQPITPLFFGRGEGPEDDSVKDLGDQATSAYNREFLFELGNGDRRLLKEVVSALQKIDEGGFGDCERCGEAISEKRLEALPFARYCIECQRAVEEEERTAAR